MARQVTSPWFMIQTWENLLYYTKIIGICFMGGSVTKVISVTSEGARIYPGACRRHLSGPYNLKGSR